MTPGSITTKIVTFFIILAIEVIANIIGFFYDATNKPIDEYNSEVWTKGKFTTFAMILMG